MSVLESSCAVELGCEQLSIAFELGPRTTTVRQAFRPDRSVMRAESLGNGAHLVATISSKDFLARFRLCRGSTLVSVSLPARLSC